jgi:copper resistance protein B
MRHLLCLVALALALTVGANRADARSPGSPQAPAAPADEHADHGQQKPAEQPKPAADENDNPPSDGGGELPAFIPRLTDAQRQAAFPDVEGHTVHDQAVHYFALFDRLEWQGGGDDDGIELDGKGWIGRDRDRVWFRAEGGTEEGRVGDARAHVLFGRQFSRWWDIVAGIRQDFRPGPAQTWAAVGVQGLAPYWFEIEATAYVGESGRTHARFEVEYELLLTNRLVLQPLLELDLSGKSDPERGIGAGLSSTEAGVRLRYEFRRELAPYAGVTWSRKYGDTAGLAEAAGGPVSRARLVTGLRLWF